MKDTIYRVDTALDITYKMCTESGFFPRCNTYLLTKEQLDSALLPQTLACHVLRIEHGIRTYIVFNADKVDTSSDEDLIWTSAHELGHELQKRIATCQWRGSRFIIESEKFRHIVDKFPRNNYPYGSDLRHGVEVEAFADLLSICFLRRDNMAMRHTSKRFGSDYSYALINAAKEIIINKMYNSLIYAYAMYCHSSEISSQPEKLCRDMDMLKRR